MSLKEIIKESGKTQQQIADEIGVHQTLVSQWSSKKTKLSLVDASKLARIIGVSLERIADCVVEEKK
jgi:transcriptional regulator with XRE-family HTH domain